MKALYYQQVAEPLVCRADETWYETTWVEAAAQRECLPAVRVPRYRPSGFFSQPLSLGDARRYQSSAPVFQQPPARTRRRPRPPTPGTPVGGRSLSPPPGFSNAVPVDDLYRRLPPGADEVYRRLPTDATDVAISLIAAGTCLIVTRGLAENATLASVCTAGFNSNHAAQPNFSDHCFSRIVSQDTTYARR